MHKNQIDYILMENRYWKSIKNSKSRPGADCRLQIRPQSGNYDKTKIKQTNKKRKNKNMMELLQI